MNTKAFQVSITFVVVTIILLLIFFVLALFLKTTFEKVKETGLESKCQLSVQREVKINLATAQTGAGHTSRNFATNVECETIPLAISERDTSRAARITLSSLEKCWDAFGKGALTLFSSARTGSEFCHICYLMTYESGVRISLTDVLMRSKLRDKADVPQAMDRTQAVIFYYKLNEDGTTEQKIAVRPVDPAQPQAFDLCANAEFPRKRLA